MASLHYTKVGSGPESLLCFHGAGQDGESCFKPFAQQVGDRFTLYAFDLFYHGNSDCLHGKEFTENEVITKEIWQDYLNQFLQENNITRFSVAGFSMGGRFALASIEAFPHSINEVFLMAPDGLTDHWLYVLATRFALTRRVFKVIAFQQDKLQRFGKWLQKLGLIDHSTIRFAEAMMSTPEKQQQIYRTWVGFRALRFDPEKLAQLIEIHHIKTWIFMGKYDKILPIKAAYDLVNRLKNKALVILESGHGRLVEKTATYLHELTPSKTADLPN